MKKLEEPSYAKINLTLDIEGRREDGYHLIKSVMQTVSLADRLCINIASADSPQNSITLRCSLPGIPGDSKNNAFKAAEMFLKAAGISGRSLDIEIIKHIPVAGGLGGSSANAASVLRLLSGYFKDALSEEELLNIAVKIGADVAFCMKRGAYLASGIGEELKKLKALPDCGILIARSGRGVSTQKIFGEYDRGTPKYSPQSPAVIRALEAGELAAVAKGMGNALQPVAERLCPQIKTLAAKIAELGALGAQMSGSGNCVFGLFNSFEEAKSAKIKLGELFPFARAFAARPVSV